MRILPLSRSHVHLPSKHRGRVSEGACGERGERGGIGEGGMTRRPRLKRTLDGTLDVSVELSICQKRSATSTFTLCPTGGLTRSMHVCVCHEEGRDQPAGR